MRYSYSKNADKVVTKWLNGKIAKGETVYRDQIADKMNEISVQKGYKQYKSNCKEVANKSFRRNPEVRYQLESKSLLLTRKPGWNRRENPYLD